MTYKPKTSEKITSWAMKLLSFFFFRRLSPNISMFGDEECQQGISLNARIQHFFHAFAHKRRPQYQLDGGCLYKHFTKPTYVQFPLIVSPVKGPGSKRNAAAQYPAVPQNFAVKQQSTCMPAAETPEVGGQE